MKAAVFRCEHAVWRDEKLLSRPLSGLKSAYQVKTSTQQINPSHGVGH